MRSIACSRIISALLALCLALEALAGDQFLRDPKLSCGLYFSKTGTHGEKISSLNPDLFADTIQTAAAEKINPAEGEFVLVGVDSEEASEYLLTRLETTLKELGYKDIPVTTIRRIAKFVEEETGLFMEEADGSLTRIAGVDSKEIAEALQQLGPEKANRNFTLVGMPFFGAKKKQIRTVLREQGVEEFKSKPNWQLVIAKAMRQPLVAASHVKDKLSYFFPRGEDYVHPTTQEIRSAAQKIMVPGLLTSTIMLSQAQPLSILIPVTLVNAANSFSTGTFRTAIGNWYRRSERFFPGQWLKNAMFSSFFATTLYWAGSGNLDRLGDILSLAGWQNFVTAKWVSIVFSTLWRAPLEGAVYQWEQSKLAGTTYEESLKIRHAGSAIQKHVSYIMTQFFIYSLVSKQSFFHFIYNATSGFSFLPGDATPNLTDTVLMSANMGNLAQATVGVFAFFLMARVSLLNYVTGVSMTIDKWETKASNLVLSPFAKLFSYLSSSSTVTKEEPK